MAEYTPTPGQVEAFKRAWHEADAEGDGGNRVSRGLAAALAQHDADLRAEVERLRERMPCDGGCDYNSGPEETCSLHGRAPRDIWDAVDRIGAEREEMRARAERAEQQVADLRAGIEALLPGETVNVYAGGGNLVSQRRVVDPDRLRTLLAESGEQSGETVGTLRVSDWPDGKTAEVRFRPAPAVPDSPDVQDITDQVRYAWCWYGGATREESDQRAAQFDTWLASLAVVGQDVTARRPGCCQGWEWTPSGVVDALSGVERFDQEPCKHNHSAVVGPSGQEQADG